MYKGILLDKREQLVFLQYFQCCDTPSRRLNGTGDGWVFAHNTVGHHGQLNGESPKVVSLTEYREEDNDSSSETDTSSSSTCSTPDLRRGHPSRVSNDTITPDPIHGSTHR